ncbi:enolase [Siccirubricoccus deserti]|uniref:Mandelate racemase/muconate lactonizing enzyme family protein n=1 Tax=Siccirubricoccus deserti TaxID=2013562 RepID=A0A9X0R181_9PROT|nr:mandelate racemase/muconate lactonizing enzyme family protein [Siccirubricoccus deserti]MBC4017614.1 mandelate racemase/muconate lactonizing enzyme family protein [Siccirubricoccus deserti]GGC60545.1 enolase [Siccirubricoccus deserti]
MTIKSVTALPLALPLLPGSSRPSFAGKTLDVARMIVVRVETDDGVVGWGETFSHLAWQPAHAALRDVVAPLAIGRDERDIGAVSLELQRILHLFGRSGAMLYALSGLEIALWDIAGKRAGKPIVELLGGARRKLLPAYASLPRYGDVATVAHHAAGAAARGYRSVKLHEIGAPQVAAARAAVGPDVALMMDTNCPWTVDQALAVAEQVRPQKLLWLEEPVWPPEDHAGLARVRAGAGIAVAAGENAASPEECIALMAAGGVDYIQPSVTKIGGIGAWMRVAREAEARGIAVMPHCPYFGAGFIATLHMVAALPGESLVEHMYYDLETSPFAAAIQPQRGSFTVPEGPGLGCEPDPEVLRRYAAA